MCYNRDMKLGERKLTTGDVSAQGKIIVGINVGAERHRGYKIQCMSCGYIADTSIKSFTNSCKRCNPARSNSISIEAHLWHRYRHGAKDRNVNFDLSIDKFSKLVKEDCFYCGARPSQKLTVARKNDNTMIYNGVDRLICELGYTESNCVPCCWPCNQAKRDWPIDVFQNMVRRWAAKCETWTIKV